MCIIHTILKVFFPCCIRKTHYLVGASIETPVTFSPVLKRIASQHNLSEDECFGAYTELEYFNNSQFQKQLKYDRKYSLKDTENKVYITYMNKLLQFDPIERKIRMRRPNRIILDLNYKNTFGLSK